MKTSTKVFSASTTLLTLVVMGMPLVALASTSSPIGTAPVTTPTPINGNVTMQTTHQQTLQKQKIHLLRVLSRLMVYKSRITAAQTPAGRSMLIQRTFTMAHMI